MLTQTPNIGGFCQKTTTNGGFGYIRLHNSTYYVTFCRFTSNLFYGNPPEPFFSRFLGRFPPLQGLTEGKNCGIFSMLKAAIKTRIPGKLPREEPVGEKALHPFPE